MNFKKIWRKIERGDWDFGPNDAWGIRMAIAESLVVFFARLKELRDSEKPIVSFHPGDIVAPIRDACWFSDSPSVFDRGRMYKGKMTVLDSVRVTFPSFEAPALIKVLAEDGNSDGYVLPYTIARR